VSRQRGCQQCAWGQTEQCAVSGGVRSGSAAHNAVGLAGESPVVGIDCLPKSIDSSPLAADQPLTILSWLEALNASGSRRACRMAISRNACSFLALGQRGLQVIRAPGVELDGSIQGIDGSHGRTCQPREARSQFLEHGGAVPRPVHHDLALLIDEDNVGRVLHAVRTDKQEIRIQKQRIRHANFLGPQAGRTEEPIGRVDLGGCPPKSPTDPGLHITRTRFLIS